MSQTVDCAIVPTAFADAHAMGVDEGKVAALTRLCRAAAHARPAALLPRGTHLALRAMAELLVAKGAAELKSGASLDRQLRMVLPYYSQQLYQDAQARSQKLFKSADEPDLTAALLRPNCIEHPSGLNCYGLPQNPEMLRFAFAKRLERCPETPGSVIPEDCRLRIDDAAVSVAVASEYLIPFIQDQLAHAPGLSHSCVNGSDAFRCFQALLATVEHAAELFIGQKDLAGALDQYSRQTGTDELVTLLPESKDFISHWTSNIPNVLRNPSETHGAFFLAPDVFSWISDNASSYQKVVAQIRDNMNAERLAVAKLGRAYLDGLVADAVSRREQLATIFPNDIKDIDLTINRWQTESRKLSEDEPEVLIVKISRMADKVLGIDQKILFMANQSANQILRECGASKKLYAKTGVFDVCFEGASKGAGVAGFRFSFAPCIASGADCDTVGHLDLLLKMRKTEKDSHSLVPIALGVTNLRGTIIAHSETLHVRRPPAPAYNLDIRQMEQSVGSLLQYPFQLKLDSETVEIADGPVIMITVRPTFSLPGMPPLAPFRVSMGPAGLKVVDDLAPTLRAAVIKQVASSLQNRQIPVAGLKVTLDADGFERAAGCDAADGGTALTLEGAADLRPALDYAPRVSLNISCNGQMQLALSSASAQGVLDEILAKGRQVLPVKAAALDAVVDGTRIQFGLGIAEGCGKVLTIDLATSNVLESANGEIAAAVASCAAIAAARRVSSSIPPFAGLTLQSDGDRACTADLPVLGRICFSPVKDIGNARLGQIHVESDGKLISAVRKQLGFASPIVDALQLRDGPGLVLPLRVTIPGLAEPVSTELPVTGNMNLADALNSSLAAVVDAKLRGKRARIGPVEVNVIRVNGDAGGLFVTGQVYYGVVGAGIRIRLIPSLSVFADAPGDREIMELIASLGMRVLGSPPIEVSIGPDGVPVLHWPVRLKVPLFGSGAFEASTIVNARANGKLRLGSVGVTVPGWFTVGYFAIGRAIIEVDLDHPENVTLGALLTIAPGEGISELAWLRGNLRHDANRKRVEIDGDLALASIPLGKSEGYWDYQKGVLDLQAGSTVNGLPFPRGRLVVDGPDCSIIGHASYDLLGSKLDAVSGFLIGNTCKRGTAATPDLASKMNGCGSRGGLGMLCLVGDVQLAAIAKTSGRMVAQLDGLHPAINAGFGLLNDNIKVEAHLNTTRARLKGNVLGIIKVTLILPTLEGMNEKTVRQMFLNFLKPSINLEALLSGRFTVNPFSPSGKGKSEETEAGSKDGDDGGNGESGDDGDDLGDGSGDRRETPSTGPSQSTATSRPTASLWFKPPPDARPGSYQGEPGPCQPKAEAVGGGPLYRVLLSCPGSDPYDEYGLLFRKEDADNLVSGSFVLQGHDPITLDDGRLFQLACTPWPCRSDGVFAVAVSKEPTKRALQAPVKILLPIGDVYRGPEVTARSLPFLRLANLIAERQLSERRAGSDTLKLICIRRTEEHCEKAAANLSRAIDTSDGSRWSVDDMDDWEFQVLNREVLAHRLLDLKCPVAKECDGNTAMLLQQWDQYRIGVSGRGQPAGLPRVMVARTPADKGMLEYRLLVLNDDGSFKQNAPITYEMGSYPLDIYDFLVPTCIAGKPGCTLSQAAAKATVPLLDQLAAAPTAPIRVGGGEAYAAAISGQGESETIFSAFKTRIGSSEVVCSRSVRWSTIRTRLSRNLDRNDALYGRDIHSDRGSEWTGDLLGSEGDRMFMKDLIKPPPLSRTGYHRSPLEFFPAPELDKNCLQVNPQ